MDTPDVAAYLECLVAIAEACAAESSATQIARDVADCIAERCADIASVAIYRAERDGGRAALLASAAASSGTPAAARFVELSQLSAWAPVQGGADASSRSVVAALEAPDGGPSRGWLLLGIRHPQTDALASFARLAAEALGSAISRRDARDDLRQREEALARREDQMSLFLGQVSNEIRTPLTLLLGPLEAAFERHGDTGLKVAVRHAHRLTRLVDALLDLSNIDAGRLDPVLMPIDIAAMTRDVASLFHGAAATAGVALTIDCPPLPQPVQVDRAQWEQVVINLIGNAIRYTASGEVRVTLRGHIGLMTLEVSDTGTDIAVDELPHVFDRFRRTRDQDDCGLGLALVRELVRLHGGDVEASSAPGQGVRFRVCIPMLGKPSRAVPHRRIAELPKRPGRSRPGDALGWAAPPTPDAGGDGAQANVPAMRERIVLVVDHRELRDYVAGVLRPHYRVQPLASFADALGAVERRSPDLVIVDFGSASAEALEFVRMLRASIHGAVVPILLLSSDTRELAHVDSMAAGADDVITKPFVATELLARVAAHMRLSNDRRELHRRLTEHNLELETQVASRTAALAASEGQFRAISNLVPDILWRADPEGRMEWRSDQWRRFTGDDGATSGMDLVHPDDRADTQDWVRETVAGRRISPHEYRLRRHDGAYRWFIARMSPMTRAGGAIECWFGSATDIERHQSVRYALEAQVDEGAAALARALGVQQELLHQLSRSQEDERRRIARELHDSLGQYLAALKLALSALGPALDDPKLRHMVVRLDSLTTEVDRELDDVISALRPVVLDELGLVGALPGIVADWSRQTGIAAEALLVQMGDERFDEESESTLYRVTQESLTNIVKHAQARNVAVTLTRRHEELHLSVEDDGVGFDITRHGSGWGLRGMAERARSVGGLLQVESGVQGGTTVLVRLPCRPRTAAGMAERRVG